MRKTRIAAIAVALAAMLGTSAAPAQADNLGGSCSLYYSGVNAGRSCSYLSLPWLTSYAYMDVDGYAWIQVMCSGFQVVNSGVMSTGTYTWTFINPGGTCVLRASVNGTLYAYAN